MCSFFFFLFLFREREGCILVADLVAFVIFHVVYFSLTLWDNALVYLGTLSVISLVRSLVLAQRMSPSVLLFSLCVLCVRACVCMCVVRASVGACACVCVCVCVQHSFTVPVGKFTWQ